MAAEKKSVLHCGKSNNHTAKQLFNSIRCGKKVRTIQALLKVVDIDVKDSNGLTPLLVACCFKRKQIVNLLIKIGANINGKSGYDEHTVFHYASLNGWTKIVKSLLSKVPDLDERDISGHTAMHLAARVGRVRVMKCLRKAGADFNRENLFGGTPLITAAQYSKKKAFNLLLKFGAIVDDSVRLLLYYASCHSWKKVLQSLVKRVPDLNKKFVMGETALDVTTSSGHLEVVKFLVVEKGANINRENEMICQAALYCATRMGHLEVVEWLLKNGPDMKIVLDVNALCCNGLTALHLASDIQHIEIVKCLVKEGADINKRDFLGMTALQLASTRGHLEVVKCLLEEGADINAWDGRGNTALHNASARGHLGIVNCLIEHGAEIDTRDVNGETALYRGSFEGHFEVVKCLLEQGADINVKNRQNVTPLLVAAARNYKHIVNLLIYSGANVDESDQMYKHTVLQFASTYGWVDITKVLVKRGCDLGARNKRGDTALGNACSKLQYDNVQVLLQAGASWDTTDKNGHSPLNYLTMNKKPEFKFIKLLIENGAYFKPVDYDALVKSSSLEVLQDVELCCQAILNKLNNHNLPELYKSPASGSLPPIEKMKIANGSKVAQAIERSVKFEIQTKGHCNILEVRHMALSALSVESVLEYYKKKTSEMNNRLKRPAAFDFVNTYQHSSKSMRFS